MVRNLIRKSYILTFKLGSCASVLVTGKSLYIVLKSIVAFSHLLTGYANFLRGLHYWKFDPVALKVVEGYPRNIGTDFFGCSAFLSN